MSTDFLTAVVVCLLALASLFAATLPALAAWRSGNLVRALRFTALTPLPLVSGLLLIYLVALSGFAGSAGWAAIGSALVLLACSAIVYRRTPEVDRFDKLVLALLGAIVFSPLTLVLFAVFRVSGEIGTAQLVIGAGVALCVVSLPAAVVLGYGAVLERVREPVPLQVRRVESSQRRQADANARQLLKDVMGDDMGRQAATRGYLEVEGKYCRYRVYPGSFRTAVLNKNGRWVGNLCVIPANSQPIPDYDQLLAKVLMLRHAEEEFWLMANLIDSGPEAWEIRDRLTGEVPASRRARIEPADCS